MLVSLSPTELPWNHGVIARKPIVRATGRRMASTAAAQCGPVKAPTQLLPTAVGSLWWPGERGGEQGCRGSLRFP